MSANDEFLDALIRHQIGLLRVSGAIRNEVTALLDATEEDLVAAVLTTLGRRRGLETPADVRRVQRLLRRLRELRLPAWRDVTDTWVSAMRELAVAEQAAVAGITRTVSPVVLTPVLLDVDHLHSIATAHPFEGKVLRDWARTASQADIGRIEAQVRIGMVQGETARQIARRLVGTVRASGRDGATETTRRQVEAITRTAVMSVSNKVRRDYYEANSAIFTTELYVATLDARTTPICRSLDGNRYPLAEGPLPPMHFNCRSLRVAVLDGDALGTRPAKPATERMLVGEYARANGLGDVRARSALPRGHKGRYDDYQRRRVRELTGTVPAKVTYQEWLDRQSAMFQDDVLGETRGRLFRQGGLSLDRFVSRSGDELPLSALARREADAFRAAGLDPEDY